MSQDFRISTTLPSHPKTKRLIRRIGEAGAWRMVCFFAWVRANRPTGDLSGLTDEDLELAADWTGTPNAFMGAMVEVGFVDGQEGARCVHDWDQHNGYAAGSQERSDNSRLASLIKHHGTEKGTQMFHAYLARRTKNPCGSQEKACGSQESAEEFSATRTEKPADSSDPQCGSHAPSSDPDAESQKNSRPFPSPSPLPLPTARARKRAFDPLTVPLPEWLSPATWARWVKHRSEIGHRLTESTAEAQVDKLGRLRAQGHDPGAVIAHSIEGGWQGLFPPKDSEPHRESGNPPPEAMPMLDLESQGL